MSAPAPAPLSEKAELIPKSESSDSIATFHQDEQDEVHTRSGEDTTKIWLRATAPLILHFISVVFLTTILKSYIDDHDFNLHSRNALVKYTPLQSDITTAGSSGIAILRLFSASWMAAMVWRCIFILMERGGITLGHINSLLTWQIHLHPRSKSSHEPQVGFLISVILLAAFPCQLSGPILTGSITWSPSNQFSRSQNAVRVASGYTRKLPSSKFNSTYPANFSASPWYELIKPLAAGVAITAWQGSQDDEQTLKRVIRTDSVARLPINSTLDDVTLPYFAVTKLEWIPHPKEELPQVVLNSYKNLSDWNPFHPMPGIVSVSGAFALIPDTWGVLTAPSHSPAIVSETRILVGKYARSLDDAPLCTGFAPFGGIPPGITPLDDEGSGCYIYARVTYVAGAAECKDCRVSSWLTVQNDTSLTVSPSETTIYALGMMPIVAGLMAQQNASLTRALNNLDGYVTALLIRSYAASWTLLAEKMSNLNTTRYSVATNIQIAVPTSRSNVLWWRVWFWLSLNLMFTLSGLLFLVLHSRCNQPLIGNPSMAALLLDTTEVLHKRNRALCNFSTLVEADKDIGSLHLRYKTMDGTHKCVEVVED